MAVKTVQATINGQVHTLTYNSTTKKYEATITAPSLSSYNQTGHYYGVTVKATDEAGNITTKDSTDAAIGTSLRLQVKEKVAPTIFVTYPTAGAYITNNKPVIKWSLQDNDSGIDTDTIGITIDSGSKITSGITTKPSSAGIIECEYMPPTALSDGAHTVKFDVSDNDGNVMPTKSVSFKVDTVAPTLSVASPANNLVTRNAQITVSGTTNDVTSSPVSVKLRLNAQTEQTVTVAADGTWSQSVTLATGQNTITVTATDSAGKSTTVTRTVTLDTAAPTIKAVTLNPNPVDAGATYVISVEVTD